MSSCFLPSLVSLILGVPIPPAARAVPPGGLAPSIKVVHSVNAEKGELYYFDFATIVVPHTEIRVVMGMKTPVTVNEEVPKTIISTLNLKESKAQTAEGKPLKTEELLKRLTPGTPVLVMTSSDKVDPAYLKIVRPEAIILFVTQVPAAGPPAKTPVPAPPPRP